MSETTDLDLPALRRLRLERPLEELAMHRRAFDHYFSLAQTGDPEAQAGCLHHLDRLFWLFNQRMEWPLFAPYLERMRTLALRQPVALQQIAFYEANLAFRGGDSARGEPMLRDLLTTADSALRPGVLLSLGTLCVLQSRYDEARAGFTELLNLARGLSLPIFEALAHFNLGLIHTEFDEFEQAIAHNRASLTIYREQAEVQREVYALYAIGRDEMYLGRWADAQANLAQAAELADTLHLYALQAAIRWAEGLTTQLLGRDTECEAAYIQAIDLIHTHAPGQRSVLMDTHAQLALLYQTQGREPEALEQLDAALLIAEALGQQHRIAQIWHQIGQTLEQIGKLDDAFEAYRSAIATIEALRETIAPDVRIEFFATTPFLYESMVLLCIAGGRIADAFNYAERARSRALLDSFGAQAVPASAVPAPAELSTIQAQLAPDAVIVEFFTAGVIPRGEHLLNRLPPESAALRRLLCSPPQIVAFIVTAQHCTLMPLRLDPNSLQPAPTESEPCRRFLAPPLLHHLHRTLLEPLTDILNHATCLFLVPHGPLHYVPFTALRRLDGHSVLDRDDLRIAFAPSASVLINCLRQQPPSADENLMIGYNGHEGRHLRYAELEAYLLAARFGGTAWIGPEARGERILSDPRRLRRLHLAGHAFYNYAEPLESGILLGEGELLSARAIIASRRPSAELVTLNACTSGVSAVVSGDELFGLPRAFLIGGIPSIIGVLWETADTVAFLLMHLLYAELRNGATPAHALRRAQRAIAGMPAGTVLAMLAELHTLAQAAGLSTPELPELGEAQTDHTPFADPVYWAGYILIGRP